MQVIAPAFPVQLSNATKQAFHADKITLCIRLGIAEEKTAIAAANLKLGGAILIKQFLHPQRLSSGGKGVKQRLVGTHTKPGLLSIACHNPKTNYQK